MAIEAAVKRKLARYPCKDGFSCLPAALEQAGAIGHDFLEFMKEMAAQAQQHDDNRARPRSHWKRRWLQQISTALALIQAKAVASAAGAL